MLFGSVQIVVRGQEIDQQIGQNVTNRRGTSLVYCLLPFHILEQLQTGEIGAVSQSLLDALYIRFFLI